MDDANSFRAAAWLPTRRDLWRGWLLGVVMGIVFLSMDVGQPFDVFDVFLRKWEEQGLAEIAGFRGWS